MALASRINLHKQKILQAGKLAEAFTECVLHAGKLLYATSLLLDRASLATNLKQSLLHLSVRTKIRRCLAAALCRQLQSYNLDKQQDTLITLCKARNRLRILVALVSVLSLSCSCSWVTVTHRNFEKLHALSVAFSARRPYSRVPSCFSYPRSCLTEWSPHAVTVTISVREASLQ